MTASWPRRLGTALLVALLLGVAYRSVVLRLADQWAQSDPERALALIPDHPAALLARAEARLRRGERDRAAVSARAALEASPLTAGAWRVLAEEADAAGERAGAEHRYRIAVRRAPRDRRVRLAVLQADLADARTRDAIHHVDVLSRIVPEASKQLLPIALELANDPSATQQLVERAALDPPWRRTLVEILQADVRKPGAQRVLEGMSAAGILSATERDAWIAGLARQGQWSEAYARWASSPERQGRPLMAVFNGGFERSPSASQFDWRTVPKPGAQVTFESGDGSSGHAARLQFHRRRLASTGLEQTLLLAPGHYVFESRARVERLVADRGLEWAVGCMGQGTALAVSPPIAAQSEWADLQFEFEVPAAGCEAQWLTLRNRATAPPLQGLEGTVWVDEVRIFPPPSSLASTASAP